MILFTAKYKPHRLLCPRAVVRAQRAPSARPRRRPELQHHRVVRRHAAADAQALGRHRRRAPTLPRRGRGVDNLVRRRGVRGFRQRRLAVSVTLSGVVSGLYRQSAAAGGSAAGHGSVASRSNAGTAGSDVGTTIAPNTPAYTPPYKPRSVPFTPSFHGSSLLAALGF